MSHVPISRHSYFYRKTAWLSGALFYLVLVLRHRLQPTRPHTRVRAVIMHEGKVLLVRNIVKSDWNIPGGNVGRNESEQAALSREVKEELRVDAPAKLYQLVGRYSREVTGAHFDIVCYKLELPRRVAHITLSKELLEARWVSPDNLPSGTAKAVRLVLKDVK